MGILIPRRITVLVTVFCLAVLLTAAPLQAEDKPLQLYEQKIKAGLVYNFLKYTSWPQEALQKGRLSVCLFIDDPLDGYLAPLKGRTAQQSTIDIAVIKTIPQAANCNMVIIPRSQATVLPKLLEFLKDKPVLTVSDISQFARHGGMVELGKDGQKINLYINQAAVEGAGLSIQGQMLKLAKLVGPGGRT